MSTSHLGAGGGGDSGVVWLSRRARAWILFGSFVISLVCGTIGYMQMPHEGREPVYLSNALYHSAQLFSFHAPHFEGHIHWCLELARWLAPITTIMAILGFSLAMFWDELSYFMLWRARDHVVVCGLGRTGLYFALQQRRQGRKVVAVDHAPSPEVLPACRKAGIPVVTGDATKPSVLKEARAWRAAKIVTLCPDDGTNCEIAVQMSKLCAETKNPGSAPVCSVQLSDTALRESLQTTDLHCGDSSACKIEFFDLFQPQAMQLLVGDLPLDRGGIPQGEKRRAHLVILGFGRMGRAIALQALNLGHFASGTRLRVSVIDRLARRKGDAFLFNFPGIASFADVEFHEHEIESPAARGLIAGWCADAHFLTSIAACFDNDNRALDVALRIQPLLKEYQIPMAVRMSGHSGLAELVGASGGTDGRPRLVTFGTEERALQFSALGNAPHEKFAAKLHEAYRNHRIASAKRKGFSPDEVQKLMSDTSMAAWENLAENLRESNRQLAAHLHIKLRAIGCEVASENDPRPAIGKLTPEQIELLAELEHRRWAAERILAGWTSGPIDKPRRITPYLGDWTTIPRDIQDYDRIFVQLIPELLATARLNICARPKEPVIT